jgi:hypothetical protein
VGLGLHGFGKILLRAACLWNDLLFYLWPPGYRLVSGSLSHPVHGPGSGFRFKAGRINYNVAWLLLTFLGPFGGHRFYMGKWISGIVYLCTFGVFGVGYIYDYWTLNDQITVINSAGE